MLEQVLQRGELPRGEAGRVSGLKERSARELLGALTQRRHHRLGHPERPGVAAVLARCDRDPVPEPVSGDIGARNSREGGRTNSGSDDGAVCRVLGFTS